MLCAAAAGKSFIYDRADAEDVCLFVPFSRPFLLVDHPLGSFLRSTLLILPAPGVDRRLAGTLRVSPSLESTSNLTPRTAILDLTRCCCRCSLSPRRLRSELYFPIYQYLCQRSCLSREKGRGKRVETDAQIDSLVSQRRHPRRSS